MANVINSGSLSTLKINDTLLLGVQKTQVEGKYQAIFVEKLIRPNALVEDDVVNDMNVGDDRFGSTGSLTYIYNGCTAGFFKTTLGMDVDIENADFTDVTTKSGKVKSQLTLNILNPVNLAEDSPSNGKRLRVKLVETITPKQNTVDNNKPKINPSTGEILHKDGMPIYSEHRMIYSSEVGSLDSHILVAHNKVTATSDVTKKAKEVSMI